MNKINNVRRRKLIVKIDEQIQVGVKSRYGIYPH